MNFFPNMMIPNNIPINNMGNLGMHIDDIYNRINDFENRLKKIEHRIQILESSNNSLEYNQLEPDNSMYML